MNKNAGKVLNEIYFDPSKEGSFGSINSLYNAARKIIDIDRETVRSWLQAQDTYTLFKPNRKRFQRLATVQNELHKQWQTDLADFAGYARYNDNFRYILVAIDVLSRFAFAEAIQRKDSGSIIKAFEKIFARGIKPKKLQSDARKEFVNSDFKRFLDKNGVIFFHTSSDEIKCSIAERFIRTLRSKIYRYLHANNTHRFIDVLQDIIFAYNNSIHRGIGMKPSEVKKSNERKVFQNLYKKVLNYQDKSKVLSKGTNVRISRYKKAFEKGSTSNYSGEIFKIDSVQDKLPRQVYKLKDLNGEDITSIFYPEDLSVVKVDLKNKPFQIEKIIKTRKRGGKTEFYVKWLDFPDKFNSWVSELQTV